MRQRLNDPPCPLVFYLQQHTACKQYMYSYVACKISFSVAGKRTLGVKKFASCSHAEVIIT
jgi:hypothetical protein